MNFTKNQRFILQILTYIKYNNSNNSHRVNTTQLDRKLILQYGFKY